MIKVITLNSGIEVTINDSDKYCKCNGCEANNIFWALTRKGSKMPVHWVETKGWVCHFEDCPKANKFRKSGLNKNE